MKTFTLAVLVSLAVLSFNAHAAKTISNPSVLICNTSKDLDIALRNKRATELQIAAGHCYFVQTQFEFECIDCPIVWGKAHIHIYGFGSAWIDYEILRKNSKNGRVR